MLVARLLLLCCFSVVVDAGSMCGCEHRYSLLMDLYRATSGAEWINNSGWGTMSPCNTDWYGVTCSGGDIVSMSLTYNNLGGTLPSSWGSMSGLQDLRLYHNKISGSLPESWSNMSSLLSLIMYANNLGGTLPSSWGSMSNLRSLSFDRCRLTGTLPSSWGNMTSLASLYLYTNSFSGTLPSSWGSMSNLAALPLDSNNLTGTLPSSWGSMPNLQRLGLSANHLSGTLPSSWGDMPSLQVLALDSNSLTGTLPSSWGNMPSLQSLSLRQNCLYGVVPLAFGSIPSLTSMSLCNTNLTGGYSLTPCTEYGSNASVWPSFCRLTIVTKTQSLTQTLSRTSSAGSDVSVASVSSLSVVTPSTSNAAPLSLSLLASVSHHTVSATAEKRSASSGSPSVTIFAGSRSFAASSTQTSTTWDCAVGPMTLVTLTAVTCLVGLVGDGVVASLSPAMVAGAPLINVTKHETPVVAIISDPLERRLLIGSSTAGRIPSIAMNLSIIVPSIATRWAVQEVQLHAEALNVSDTTSNTVGWHALVLSPPMSGMWVPAVLPLLQSTTLPLTIAFSCDGATVLRVSLVIPAPGVEQQLAGEVKLASQVSQMLSLVSNGVSGSTVSRMLAQRNVIMCSGAAFSGGVLDLGLQPCEYGTTSSARSAVLSNVVLLAVVLAALLSLTILWAWRMESTVMDAARIFSLPSSLLPVALITLPSTAAGTTLVAVGLPQSGCSTLDSVMCVVGAALCVSPPAVFLGVWLREIKRWSCAPPSPRHAPCDVVTPSATLDDPTTPARNSARVPNVPPMGRALWLCEKVPLSQSKERRGLLLGAFERQWKWSESTSKHDGSSSMRNWWVVLLEYRVLWYPALDSTVLALIGVFGVIGGAAQRLCEVATVLVFFLLLLQLVVLSVVRPFTTLFSFVYSTMTLSLTILSTSAQVLFSHVSASDTSGLWLLSTSAACDFAVIGITFARSMFDLLELFSAVRHRVTALSKGCRNETSECSTLDTLPLEVAADASGEEESATHLDTLQLSLLMTHSDSDKEMLLCDEAEAQLVTFQPTLQLDVINESDAAVDAHNVAVDAQLLEEAEREYWSADGVALVRDTLKDGPDATLCTDLLLGTLECVEHQTDHFDD
jgi:hypothetical protein